MNDLSVDALSVLIARGDVPGLPPGTSWLAVTPPLGWAPFAGAGTVVTPWADVAASFTESVRVMTRPEGPEKYPYVVVFPEKDHDAARGQMALALQACAPDGVVVAVAANDAGGRRLNAVMAELGVEIVAAHAKHHCKIVVVRAGGDAPRVRHAIEVATVPAVRAEGFVTLPGLHSDHGVDGGSRLLAAQLPKTLSGVGADFGCGWGYLSVEMLRNCSGITALSAIDADARAVMCTQQNIATLVPEKVAMVATKWADLTRPSADLGPFDFIGMNPPFHSGKATVPALGMAMIRTAQACLRPRGSLYLVANRHLPYEAVLNPLFPTVTLLIEEAGFKVYQAVKA